MNEVLVFKGETANMSSELLDALTILEKKKASVKTLSSKQLKLP